MRRRAIQLLPMTCIAVMLMSPSATAAPVPGALSATKARAAAEDRVLARIGLAGTLASLRCTRVTPRAFTCRGAGSMFMADGTEHGYTATSAVRNVRTNGRWRTVATVRIVHDATEGGGGASTGGHAH